MIKQKQLFRHNPEAGVYGDCHRTVLACLLHIPVQDVPHFGALHWKDPDAWDAAVLEFLEGFDLSLIRVLFNNDNGLEGVLAHMQAANPNAYYMLTGTSGNDTNHIVICQGDKIVWDTAQDVSGIVGPCDDGFYLVEHLIPSFMVYNPEPEVTENLIQHQLKLEGAVCESLS